MSNPPKSLGELRLAFPNLGFAIYAYEPGHPVTLEIFDQGEVYSFAGATEADAIAAAFPPVTLAPLVFTTDHEHPVNLPPNIFD